jgi:hypothetical protein
MISRVLVCFLEVWNTFDRVGIPLYRVGMLRQGWNASTGLECFRQCWNTLVQSWNAFYWVGMHCTELEYLCTELECFLLCWNAFCRVGMLATVLECFRQCWNAF